VAAVRKLYEGRVAELKVAECRHGLVLVVGGGCRVPGPAAAVEVVWRGPT